MYVIVDPHASKDRQTDGSLSYLPWMLLLGGMRDEEQRDHPQEAAQRNAQRAAGVLLVWGGGWV